jgi:hypothetical protein
MKHLPIDLSLVNGSGGLLALVGLLPDLKAHIKSEEEQDKFKVLVSQLHDLDDSIVYLSESDLQAAQGQLKQLATLGTFVASLSNNDQGFLLFFEGILGPQIAKQLVELMALAYRIHQKIEIVLHDPDPDENDPDFQRFLSELAEKASEEKGPMNRGKTLRESLGL